MSLRGLSTDKLENFLITLDANYGLYANYGEQLLSTILHSGAYLSTFGHLDQRLSNISHALIARKVVFSTKLSAD